jgi:hypothetical protein
MGDAVGLIVLLIIVPALIALDIKTGHTLGDKVYDIFGALIKFVFLVAIVAGIGWGIWKAGAWVFGQFNDDNATQYEESYEEGYYDALDCVKRKGGSASSAVAQCR